MTGMLDYPIRRTCPFDPPGALSRLRDEAAIARVKIWDGTTPWLVTRYEEVRQVLSDRRFSPNRSRPGFPAVSPAVGSRRGGPTSFFTMDDPEHARLRGMLSGEFTGQRVESMRPLVADTVSELLESMASGSRPADLVQAFSLPLPSKVICSILGVPYADHEFFQARTRELFDLQATPADSWKATVALTKYLLDLVELKAADPGDDLISRLIADRVNTGELPLKDVAAMARLLLIAGHETTAAMISMGTLMLLQYPDEAAEIRDSTDPAVVSGAVDELLRVLTVTHTGRRRTATEDVEVGGVLIRAGEGVIAAGELANRDPAVFDHPDEFDIHRRKNHHLAFGFGWHGCLGPALASIELQIAYPALLRRFPGLRLATGFDTIQFRDQAPAYGVWALPVTW